jgi:NAD(P)-dependent dehydrogenase (short-subunit alcohol dehydrogenase family)
LGRAFKNAVKDAKSPTKFIAHSCDITNSGDVTALWGYLAAQGIKVDVLVLNAAKFGPLQSLFEQRIEEVWSQFEANVKGPLHFAELFSKQDSEFPKVTCSSIVLTIHNTMLTRKSSFL